MIKTFLLWRPFVLLKTLFLVVLALVLIDHVLPLQHWRQGFVLWQRIPSDILGYMLAAAAVAYGVVNGFEVLQLRSQAKNAQAPESVGSLLQAALGRQLRRSLHLARRQVEQPVYSKSTLLLLLLGVAACVAAAALLAPELFMLPWGAAFWPGIGLFLLGLLALLCRAFLISRERSDTHLLREFIKPVVGSDVQAWFKPVLLFIPAGLTLYLPLSSIPHLSFVHFACLYGVAHMAGVLSRVPGGTGVFEGVFLVLAAKLYPPIQVFASLIAYRGVYYLFPLGCALAAWLLLDIRKTQQASKKVPFNFAHLPGKLFQPLVSVWLLLLAITYWQGHTPWMGLSALVPAPPAYWPAYIHHLLGVVFFLVWRCHWLRSDLGYALTALCLIFSAAVFALGHLWIGSAIAMVVLWVFLPSAPYFYRRSALLQGAITAKQWRWYIFGVFLWVSASVLLSQANGIEHVVVSQWLHTEALSPFEKLFFISHFCFGVFATYSLLVRCDSHWELPSAQQLAQVRPLVATAADTQAYLALMGDKYLFWSHTGNSCLAFGKVQGFWVAMGDPMGDAAEFPELIKSFAEAADVAASRIAIYKADEKLLPLYIRQGMTAIKLGDEARVDLASFSLAGGKNLNLRNAYNKNIKEGLLFAILTPDELSLYMPRLKRISECWLNEKHVREKQFSLGAFNEDYLRECLVAVVWWQGEIIAFANLWHSAAKDEVALDLMRYTNAGPKRVMEFLTVSLLHWAKEAGYVRFNMGLAPLSGLQAHKLAPISHKLGHYLFSSHTRFYHFAGIYTYKEKFSPRWEGRYLVLGTNYHWPVALLRIAELIAGGTKGVFSK